MPVIWDKDKKDTKEVIPDSSGVTWNKGIASGASQVPYGPYLPGTEPVGFVPDILAAKKKKKSTWSKIMSTNPVESFGGMAEGVTKYVFDPLAGATVGGVENLIPGKQSGEKVGPQTLFQNPVTTWTQLGDVRRDPNLPAAAGIAADILNPSIIIGAATLPAAGARLAEGAAARGLISGELAQATRGAAESVRAFETGQAINPLTRASEQALKESIVRTKVSSAAKVGDALAEAEAKPFKAVAGITKGIIPNPIKEAASKVDMWAETHLADRYAFGNKAQGRVKTAGIRISPEMDVEAKVSLLGGAAEKGTQIYKETIAGVERALKTDIPVTETGYWRTVGKGETLDSGRLFKNQGRFVWEPIETAIANATEKASLKAVNEYVMLKHAHEIFMMKGNRMFVGKTTGPADVLDKLTNLETRLGPKELAKVKAAAEVVQKNYEGQLISRTNAGLISPEMAQFLHNNYPWYNPIRYLDEAQAHSEGMSRVISNSDNGLQRLGEIGIEGELVDPLNAMWLSNLKTETLIAKNDAAKTGVKIFQADPQLSGKVRILAEGEKPANNMGTISYMENGKRVVLEVPRDVENWAKQLSVIPKVDTFRIAGAINAVSRAGTTGLNIAFFIPNIAVDGLTALITQGVGPLAVTRRLAYNLKGLIKEDPVMARMLKAKAGMSGFWGKSTEELTREAAKNGNLVLKDQMSFKRFITAPFRAIAEVGHAIEMAPRAAVFEKNIAKGATEEQAALAARRATIDFARAGTLTRELNSMFLYLNASVQGSLVPFRALRDIPMARLRVTGFMGLVAANYAYNRQFPEYADVPNYYKFGSGLLFMVPSNDYDKRGNKIPHFITIIPNQREWSLFSAPITYALSKLDGNNPEDFSQFIGELVPRVNPLSQMTGQGGLPIPTQAGETFISGFVLNKDFFTGKPVVPPELQNLPEEDQYDEYSSQASIRAGKVLGVSPKKLDYFVKGVFGGLGGQMLEAIDYVDSKLSSQKPDERIQDMVGKLEEIQKSTSPDQIESARNKYLYSLSEKDREDVLALERHPAERMPVITNISRRIYHESGGQLYQTGQAIASKKTGISKSQSRMASMALSQYNSVLQSSQESIDEQLKNNKITTVQWRDLRKQLGLQYQGAMGMVKVTYPQAAQSAPNAQYQDWLTKVYTLGGAMPDIRSRANVLVSAYRSIVPEGELGQEDWDTYFQRQTDFKVGLIGEDRAMLENELQSRMTDVEKKYYSDQELIRPYWGIDNQVISELSAKPGYQNVKELQDALNKQWAGKKGELAQQQVDPRLWGSYKSQLRSQYPALVLLDGQIVLRKQQWKLDPNNRDAAIALKYWYQE